MVWGGEVWKIWGAMDRRYIKGGSVFGALNSVFSRGGGEGPARHLFSRVEEMEILDI